MAIKGGDIDRLRLLRGVCASAQPRPRPRGGCMAPSSAGQQQRWPLGQAGCPEISLAVPVPLVGCGSSMGDAIGVAGKRSCDTPGTLQAGFWWLCYFEMVPLGQGSSKSANGNLEGNARKKRGVREPEGGKHWEKGGWFSFISQIFPASLHVVRTGMLLGENTWTFLRISSSKPRGFFTCGANLSPLTQLGPPAGCGH